MLNKNLLLLLTIGVFFLQSCVNSKNLVYFENGDEKIENLNLRETVLEIGDILSIEVTGGDAEIVKPFNQTELVRQGNQSGSYDNGVAASFGYLISTDSTITMPVIGKLKVAGLTKNEATQRIQDVLANYLNNPSISLRILNFKVTVLGEVENPGTFAIPNERISVLEAIGIAKDLKITGKRTNVLVIRSENNIKSEYRLDLTSKNIFESPAYYLKQNDIVYVEPNKKARYDATVLRSTGGIIISATSLIVSTLVIIFK